MPIIADKILDYIKVNRVSTTEVADALYKTGELDNKLKPIVTGIRSVGFVEYAMSVYNSNWHFHKKVKESDLTDKILLVEPFKCGQNAVFGALVSKYTILYKRSVGIVVLGNVRDASYLLKERFPIWCHGFTPIGCSNNETDFPQELFEYNREMYQDSIIVADDGGVILIPRDKLTQETYDRLEFIEKQEDEWFNGIDYHKFSTFDVVCLGKRGNNDDNR